MAKKESTFLNMVLTLLVITLLASAALGVVYSITKEPRAAAELAKKTLAIRRVVPEFNNDPVRTMYTVPSNDGTGNMEFYVAEKDGEIVGVAVRSYTLKGFSGKFEIVVGFDTEGTIHDISVLNQKETPGLGTKMAEPEFISQFKDKNPDSFLLKVKKDGGQVDAITAATISSRAFCDAVQRAYDAFNAEKGGTK